MIYKENQFEFYGLFLKAFSLCSDVIWACFDYSKTLKAERHTEIGQIVINLFIPLFKGILFYPQSGNVGPQSIPAGYNDRFVS